MHYNDRMGFLADLVVVDSVVCGQRGVVEEVGFVVGGEGQVDEGVVVAEIDLREREAGRLRGDAGVVFRCALCGTGGNGERGDRDVVGGENGRRECERRGADDGGCAHDDGEEVTILRTRTWSQRNARRAKTRKEETKGNQELNNILLL